MHFLRYKIIGAPKKFKKFLRPLFWPKTNHIQYVIKSLKPNPSREIVPLRARLNVWINCFLIRRDPRCGPHNVLPELVPVRVRGHTSRQHISSHLGRLPLRGL